MTGDQWNLLSSVVTDMLHELDPDEPVWAIIGRRFSARQMIALIESNSDEGRQYVLDTMRVARDVIAHSSKKARV